MKRLLAITAGILVLVLGIEVSYSMWIMTNSQDSVNAIETTNKCFNVELTSESDNIKLENAYPITDEAGSKLSPYSFKITNTCEWNAYYKVNLETLSSSTIDNKFIKASLDNSNPQVINKYMETETTLEDGKSANSLKTGYLPVGGSVSFDLRLWMDYETTIADIKNDGTDKWTGKIVVVSSLAEDKEILAACQNKGGDLIDEGECRKYYVKLNQLIQYPDFEKLPLGGFNAESLIIQKNNLHFNPENKYVLANANFYIFSNSEANHVFYEFANSNINYVQFHFQTYYWLSSEGGVVDDTIPGNSNFSFDPKFYSDFASVYYVPSNLSKYFKEAKGANPDFSKSLPFIGVSFYIGEERYLDLSYKNINLIDLTLMFGDGNEPDKEWCDKYLTNYLEYNSEGTMTPIKEVGEPIKTAYYDVISLVN